MNISVRVLQRKKLFGTNFTETKNQQAMEMTSQAEITTISDQFLTTHVVFLHKPSCNYYCITKDVYEDIQNEQEETVLSKLHELQINCNLIDKGTGEITNIVECLYARDLLAAAIWKNKGIVVFGNAW